MNHAAAGGERENGVDGGAKSGSSMSKFLRNGMVVSGGSALAAFLRIVRNVILAHLLSQGDFGVCVVMATLLSSAQLLTNFGFESLLIQERRVDDQKLQPVLASLIAMRMGLAALFLFLSAGLMSRLLGVPEAANTFRLLAVSLLPMGFLHLDTTRFQKHYRFGPDSIVTIANPLFDLVLTISAVYVLRTYHVVPFTMILSAIATTLLSFWLAERPFRMAWDSALVKHALRFGLPLIPVGLIILASAQADRIVIGAETGVVNLAIYGATMTVISAPAIWLSRIESSLFLPRLAESALDPKQFRKRFMQVGVVVNVVPVLVMVPIMVFGQDLVSLLFGARYHPPSALIWTVALGQASVLVRLWSNMGAMARGDTKNALLSNVYRVSGIFLAIAAAKFHLGLVVIAASFSIGEFLGLVGAFGHLFHQHTDLIRGTVVQLLMIALVFTGAVAVTELLAGSPLLKGLATIVLVGCYVATVARSTEEGRMLLSKIRRETGCIFAKLKCRSTA